VSASTGRWLFAFGMLLAALAGGAYPYRELRRITTPTDFKYDFISAYWIAHGLPAAALDRDAADALGETLGTQPGPFWPGAPAQTHPPPATILILPLVPLGYRGAALAWFVLSLVCVAWLARLLLAIWRRASRLPPWGQTAPLALALALWPPTVFNLAYGQWSVLLALVVSASWWRYEQGSPRSAVGWLAAAIAIKATPTIVLGYFGLRARRIALATVAVVALISLGTLPLTGGVGAWRAFVSSGAVATRIFEGWIHNTASIRGLFVRAFVNTGLTTAVFHAPAVGHALAALTSAALIALAFVVTWRARRDDDPAPAFAAWACLAVLLNPLAWPHNVLLLALPSALLARAPAASSGRRTAVAIALVLITIPYEALVGWAGGSPPLSAATSWLLGAHALGALLLFATALAAAGPSTAPALSAGSPPEPS
jgi:hypothetical protein